MIELKNGHQIISNKACRKYILKDMSIVIPSNKNIGILGKNGAGKSTIMRMLGQIEFPNKGTIISKQSFSWPLGLGGVLLEI